MVRDFIYSNYCDISFRSKEFPIALKKIGSYIGKFKNTLNSFQKEVSSINNEVDLENEDTNRNKKIEKDK